MGVSMNSQGSCMMRRRVGFLALAAGLLATSCALGSAYTVTGKVTDSSGLAVSGRGHHA